MAVLCRGRVHWGKNQVDEWTRQTGGRAGTFDVGLRDALAGIVEKGGFFDMGSLPNYQQDERARTVPFINSHDTWKGAFWDSEPTSSAHDDRTGDWRRNDEEAMPTTDPDNPRADVAYAAAFAVDGSPMVFYEDLFVNYRPDRFTADPAAHPVRAYVANLIFKDGAYKVLYQNSPDLLIIERSGRALIGLNDHGSEWLSAEVETDFGGNVRLHDYSGANRDDIWTDGTGRVRVWAPPMGYTIWGRADIQGGFNPASRRTVQEFQLDDDLGDARAPAPSDGGKIRAGGFARAGAIWAAAGSSVKAWVYADGERDVELRVSRPDIHGARRTSDGEWTTRGRATGQEPVRLELRADREGYHVLAARLTNPAQAPTRAYIKIEYEAPRNSGNSEQLQERLAQLSRRLRTDGWQITPYDEKYKQRCSEDRGTTSAASGW